MGFLANLGGHVGCRPGDDVELRVHDGIVGGLLLGCFYMSQQGTKEAAWLGMAVSGLMVGSAVCGYCPVHHTLALLGLKDKPQSVRKDK